jgi:archaellum component FlaC
MKPTKIVITFLAVTAFAVGCKPADEKATATQLDNVKVEAKAAAQDIKDYTYTQKDAFVEKMRSEIAALNDELDQLAAKIEKTSDAAKAEAKPKLQALREQVSKLSQQLETAKNATESTWDDVKAASSKAYSDAKDSFNKARQWVSDKIAP